MGKHCSFEEVRSVYLKLAKKFHPDVALQGVDSPSEEAQKKVEDRFKEYS